MVDMCDRTKRMPGTRVVAFLKNKHFMTNSVILVEFSHGSAYALILRSLLPLPTA
jgi:hypothetical protein